MKKMLHQIASGTLGAVSYVQTGNPVAALTFDDGPHPEYTPQLLGILAKHQAQATFFMIGELASRYPELVTTVGRAGHAIGNHSWSHPRFPGVRSRLSRWKQIRACERAIAPYSSRIFRPPYGAHNLATRLDAFLLGYKVVMWNLSFTDWLPFDPDEMAEKIIEKVHPGSIILLHDAIYGNNVKDTLFDRAPMLEALDIALTKLGDRIRFITVPALLQAGNVMRQRS